MASSSPWIPRCCSRLSAPSAIVQRSISKPGYTLGRERRAVRAKEVNTRWEFFPPGDMRAGFAVVGLVGRGGSPLCGVCTALDLGRSIEAIAGCPHARMKRHLLKEAAIAACLIEQAASSSQPSGSSGGANMFPSGSPGMRCSRGSADLPFLCERERQVRKRNNAPSHHAQRKDDIFQEVSYARRYCAIGE